MPFWYSLKVTCGGRDYSWRVYYSARSALTGMNASKILIPVTFTIHVITGWPADKPSW